MKHLIIGNGPAGVIAAETIRKLKPEDGITLIGDEPSLPYSRMAIPYLLMGDIDEAGTLLRKDREHFARQRIELVREHIDRVDTARRAVRTLSGEWLAYDRLLIASGSSPIKPPLDGIELPGVLPCWTLEHARRIAERLKPGNRVLQMGAGFIGCIMMESLAARGVELTVVEMGNRMVPRMMTEIAGDLIRQWCVNKGVTVFVSTKVEAIAQSGPRLVARLSNDRIVEADLVISATGVKPNIAFLHRSGIECAEGVLVDQCMQTSVPGVYAAGDVAQAVDFSTGERAINAIQPVAADEARLAGSNMAGRQAWMRGSLSMNVLDTMGLVASSFGQWWGAVGGEHSELVDRERFRYLRLEFKDDLLIGATSLGLTEHVGVLRGLIQTQVRLGPWKERLLRDPTRVMEAYLARAQAAA
jgi:NAD(P)H-nitrite reductase large subunit